MRNLSDLDALIAATEAELSELNTRQAELTARLARLQQLRANLLPPIEATRVDDG